MKRFNLLLAVLLLALGALAACSGGGQKGDGAQPPRETAAPAAKATQASTDLGGGGNATTGGDLALTSRDAGLDKLKSYRVRWQSQWNSTDGDKTTTTNWDWTEEFSSSPDALHWTWKSIDSTNPDQSGIEAWQIGDTTYMQNVDKEGKTQCYSFSSQDPNQHIQKGVFSPTMLGSLTGAQFIGNETVNGVATKHYKYDEKATSLASFGKINGEVWVSAESGYVVKDQMNWEGGAGFIGAKSTGTGKGQWVWQVLDANKPVTITPPQNCGGDSQSLPVMSDAQDKTTLGGTIIYKSASSVDAILQFYQTEMSAAGWKAEGDPMKSEAFANISFSKDGKKAQINVTSDKGTQTVMITVQ